MDKMRNAAAGADDSHDGRIRAFALAAERFYSFLESDEGWPRDGEGSPFCTALLELLADLLVCASRLPRLTDLPDPTEEGAGATTRARAVSGIRSRVGRALGEHDVYWEVFDPYQLEEPVAAALSDDLSDIYGDLKEGLLLYRLGGGDAVRAAAWHWRFTFETHWGDHLTDCLRALHRIPRHAPQERAEDRS